MGHGVGPRSEEHCRTLNAMGRLYADAADEDRQRQATLVETADEQLLAALPGGHQHKQHDPRQYREGAALEDLRRVGCEEQAIHQQAAEQQRHGQHRWPFPQQQHHRRHQDGGHQHGARHSYAVGRGQGTGGT